MNLSTAQVASLVGVSVQAVNKAVREGRLRAVKVEGWRRYDPKDVEEYAETVQVSDWRGMVRLGQYIGPKEEREDGA